MRQYHIEVFTTLVDNRCQSDNLWTSSHHNDQLQFSIVLKLHITIIKLWLFVHGY